MLKIYETFRQNTAVAIFRVLQFLESYMGKAVTGEMELIAGQEQRAATQYEISPRLRKRCNEVDSN